MLELVKGTNDVLYLKDGNFTEEGYLAVLDLLGKFNIAQFELCFTAVGDKDRNRKFTGNTDSEFSELVKECFYGGDYFGGRFDLKLLLVRL